MDLKKSRPIAFRCYRVGVKRPLCEILEQLQVTRVRRVVRCMSLPKLNTHWLQIAADAFILAPFWGSDPFSSN